MKFSIIVTVYNTEKYILKCLESIDNQTYDNYEVIIIDDGSNDKSAQIIKKFIQKKPKYHYFWQKNAGIAMTRNAGLKHITGDYLIFIDSDDYIEKDLLFTLNQKLKEKPVTVLKYNLNIIKDLNIQKNITKSFTNLNFDAAINYLIQDKFWDPACLYTFKVSFWQEHKFTFTQNKVHEDFGLVPLILMVAENISSIDYVGYNYWLHKESITQNITREKAWRKFNDTLYFYSTNIPIIDACSKINNKSKKILKSFYANGVINRARDLDAKDLDKAINMMQKRKVFNNLITSNPGQFFKKYAYKLFPKVLIKGGQNAKN